MSSTAYPLINISKTKRKSTAREAVLALNQNTCSKDFEVKDYQEIISKANIENELSRYGYKLLNRIVVGKTQYLKTVNKKGQTVFILVDVEGYTTVKNTDLVLSESERNFIPHSVKSGISDCIGNEVFGVLLESSGDVVCLISKDDDLKVKESTFVFESDQETPQEYTIPYPVVKMSEVRTAPDLILDMTDKVTRRLRNKIFTSLLQDLKEEQKSVSKLVEVVEHFNKIKDEIALKINKTLTQLEEWNKIYDITPPVTDEGKERYKKLQYNLEYRNSGITTLLSSMKKVADQKKTIDKVASEISTVTKIVLKDFENIDYVVTE